MTGTTVPSGYSAGLTATIKAAWDRKFSEPVRRPEELPVPEITPEMIEAGITPEMIEAGAMELLSFDPEFDGVTETAERVIRAALRV